jgi:hypothetical protein
MPLSDLFAKVRLIGDTPPKGKDTEPQTKSEPRT